MTHNCFSALQKHSSPVYLLSGVTTLPQDGYGWELSQAKVEYQGGHLSLVSAYPTSEAEVRGVVLSVPRCLWCFGARTIFKMEDHDEAFAN